ncbi:MAG: hypothetical protein AAGU14_12260, partial [Eubacteriaceae bacterium]
MSTIKAGTTLYSTGTLLAFKIAQRYYNNIHYVWCSTRFSFGFEQPESSNPSIICRNYLTSIATRDNHSSIIENNKLGILKGAAIKRKEGIINDRQELEIRAMTTEASFLDFMPVIYVINASNVLDKCKEAPVADRAAPHSIEYIIRELPRVDFDIINMKIILRDFAEFS